MAIRTITTCIILALLSSCASVEKNTESPEALFSSALGSSSTEPGKITTLPGADRSDSAMMPVINPPQILRIWVYDHITPTKDMVVGHWVFIKLKDASWYIEDEQGRDAKSNPRVPIPPQGGPNAPPTPTGAPNTTSLAQPPQGMPGMTMMPAPSR